MMDHECEEQQFSPLIFTSLQGKVFQVDLDEIPQLPPTHQRSGSVKSILELRPSSSIDANDKGVEYGNGLEAGIGGLDGSTVDHENKEVTRTEEQGLKDLDRGRSTLASHFIPTQLVEPMSNLSMQLPSPPQTAARATSRDASPAANFDADQVWMVYNEYGELVEVKSVLRLQSSRDMKDITQIMRLFKKVYHHEFRNSMIEAEQVDRKGLLEHEKSKLAWTERLSSWEYQPATSKNSPIATPEEKRPAKVCQGPPRVLEIGCSDGNWCFQAKKAHPDWIIDGIDDTSHWICMNKDIELRHDYWLLYQCLGRSANIKCRDFMLPKTPEKSTDYFNPATMSQIEPEFKARNLNCLLNHREPIPRNFYSFIRGRDIFDRSESYKNLLDDIRLILQPDGVVEFIEIDARPRHIAACRSSVNKAGDDHESRAQTGWTDCIADRLVRPSHTDELASDVPGWMRRVEERQKATMRPRDGIPAVNLKSWLEGAGFWDVHERIRRLRIGGTTTTGKRIKDFILYQTELEDSIPQLKENLPPVEADAVESGNYYLTVHIVTARKPPFPRAGDRLTNGSREGMSDEKHDYMSRGEVDADDEFLEMIGRVENHQLEDISQSSALSESKRGDEGTGLAGMKERKT
ncbi:hypothetical protein ACMFMF_002827 [Clarireedia jacksonii]